MGYAKERLLQESEQGWAFVDDKYVCAKCFDDHALRELVKSRAEKDKCNYCKRRSKKTPIAAPVNDVLERIGEGLWSEWDDPANALPYESAEGGYQGTVYDTREVFDTIGSPFASEAIQEEILDAFGSQMWCERDPFGLSEDDALRYGWRDFVVAVKYKTRYLFSVRRRTRRKALLSDTVPPEKMLQSIGKVINDVGLVRTLAGGTRWYRARVHETGKSVSKGTELETPRRSAARFSNRMSPAGIPMFYGASDRETAIRETYGPEPGKTVAITVGTFRTAREFDVIDLTDLPHVPSLFDESRRHLRSAISFLRDFVEDLAKPIEKDGREHIEFVPTQIVTEYVRHIFRSDGGRKVRGIIYKSARNGAEKCCVLFFRNTHCCDQRPDWEQDPKKWLGLARAVFRKEMTG